RHCCTTPYRCDHPLLSYSLPSSARPATPPTSTLSLHDALPICPRQLDQHLPPLDGEHPGLVHQPPALVGPPHPGLVRRGRQCLRDRKSTRLNSSHVKSSYAVFCLKKKKTDNVVAHAQESHHLPP